MEKADWGAAPGQFDLTAAGHNINARMTGGNAAKAKKGKELLFNSEEQF
jgi:hypothetical protein